MAGKWKKVASR